jgi:hypothetical protein
MATRASMEWDERMKRVREDTAASAQAGMAAHASEIDKMEAKKMLDRDAAAEAERAEIAAEMAAVEERRLAGAAEMAAVEERRLAALGEWQARRQRSVEMAAATEAARVSWEVAKARRRLAEQQVMERAKPVRQAKAEEADAKDRAKDAKINEAVAREAYASARALEKREA